MADAALVGMVMAILTNSSDFGHMLPVVSYGFLITAISTVPCLSIHSQKDRTVGFICNDRVAR